MKKKVLVCGITGFMGRNIAERFLSYPEDYDIYGVETFSKSCPLRGLTKLYSVDLTTKKGVDHVFAEQYDIVIQAAAVTSGSKDITERPYIHVTDNALMNSLILRACYETSVKHFIFLSCGVMYQPGENPRTEEDFNEHDTLHKSYFGVGWTKVYIEKMCEFYSSLGRTKHIAIRHSNTFGHHDKYDLEHSHVFGATIRKVMDAKDGDSITVWGSGEDTARDLIYVDNVVDFILKAINLQLKPFELVNVSYGKAITVKEMVETIIELSGKKLSIIYDNSKPTIPTKLALSNSYALKVFGWAPKISFQEGIKRTLNWYKENYK
ncbi:MAG: NAD-dependent epimerase/dehydratase family protein [Candidatus Omnitrophica bacterium]|jgi:nucleoside-diphosphate-sugar epimerase|nr:NAD-dependent epimerase/dehydratase family protein [Candidatus Omnitrophota bacterium]